MVENVFYNGIAKKIYFSVRWCEVMVTISEDDRMLLERSIDDIKPDISLKCVCRVPTFSGWDKYFNNFFCRLLQTVKSSE